jgi:phosphate-selective porin OprO/OprP
VFTGEEASFTDVKPKHPFNPRNGIWGAVELAARYHELAVDEAAFPVFADTAKAAGKAAALGVGINWYLDRQFKVSANYEQTTFDRGSVSGDRETEKALLIRFQVAY